MPVLPLVTYPDPQLKLCSETVEEVNDELRALIDNMFETMYANQGIGLAAVQVGVHKRVLVIDLQSTPDANEQYVMINPEIDATSEEYSIYEEGCLSFPGIFAEVSRPASLTVRFLDQDGIEQTLQAEGLLATCIQHEIDHLNGVVFPDHVSRLKRAMLLKKLTKSNKRQPPDS